MITLPMTALFLSVLLAAAWRSYIKGREKGRLEGIYASLDHLIEEGRINVLDAVEAEDSI